MEHGNSVHHTCIQPNEILSKAIDSLNYLKRKKKTEQNPRKILHKNEHQIEDETESESVSKHFPVKEVRKNYPVGADCYKLQDEIGKGGSAVVYSAQCLPLNETVAIKCLDLDKSNAELTKMVQEVRTLRLLSHPNVLTAHCAFIVDTHLWEVMPFMAAGSFHTILKTAYPNGLEEGVIATVLKETLKALAYLHSEGHIHRDVKAANILLDNDGSVKLADLGVSAFIYESAGREKMRRHTFSGTVFWMAPEVLFTDDYNDGYDCKADIWSFGMTAMELAQGRPPFCSLKNMEVIGELDCGIVSQLSDSKFSKSFKEMVSMCLVHEPHERPSAEKLLKHSFFKHHAKTPEYIVRHVLEGLRPLLDRMKVSMEEKCKHSLQDKDRDKDKDKALLQLTSTHRLEDEEEENGHD